MTRKTPKATLHGFAVAEEGTVGGRYASITKSTVIGSGPVPQYPAASPHHFDPSGDEPPLGISIDAVEPVGTAVEVEASLGASSDEGRSPLIDCDGGSAPHGDDTIADASETSPSPFSHKRKRQR